MKAILKKVNIAYLLVGAAYILYYFTHLTELYILIGLVYLFVAFRHH
ncbi:MAG TPA: hypothetical protein PK646_03535 [Bacillota bacterium]|nr:hypothetical protein [Fastidiosipila sp.]HQB81145.1 hypothetical protein [Bacillota bacterium]